MIERRARSRWRRAGGPALALAWALCLAGSAPGQELEAPTVSVDAPACLPLRDHGVITAKVEFDRPGTRVHLYFRRFHHEVEDFYATEMYPMGEGRYWGVLPHPEDRWPERFALDDGTETETEWADWWQAKELSEHRDPNGDLDTELIGERAQVGKQVARDWMQEMSPLQLQDWLEGLENEPVEVFVTVEDASGNRVAQSATEAIPVRDDCRLRLTAHQRGQADNQTIRHTADWQRGYGLFHWRCDGLVSRIDPIGGAAYGDPACRACLMAYSRGEEPYEIIRIFYGTDRAPTGKTVPNDFYGGERSRDGLLYGTCEVSIPRSHEVGEIERPSWWKLEFREDPEKHVVLARVRPRTRGRFFTLLSRRVGKSARREAFVFIHGFNVSFPEAAWRTGQIAYDLNFDGAPILYSWPSQGGTLKYTVDETNVRWTEGHLERFLGEIVEKSGTERLYLIAHSMGNRALTEVLKDLAVSIREGKMPAFTEIFLTAPDIDADTFRDEIAPKITGAASHLTLYASANDRALKVSKGVNGYPRAGDAGEGLVVVDGIDTIDASRVSTDFLGHSYFDSVVPDIDLVISRGLPPLGRGLFQEVRGTLRYWVLEPRED